MRGPSRGGLGDAVRRQAKGFAPWPRPSMMPRVNLRIVHAAVAARTPAPGANAWEQQMAGSKMKVSELRGKSLDNGCIETVTSVY